MPRIVQRLLFLVLPRLWPCCALSTYVNLVSTKKTSISYPGYLGILDKGFIIIQDSSHAFEDSSWKFGVPRGSTQPSGLSATKKNSHLGKLLLKEKDHAVLFFLAQVGTVRWRVEVGTLYAGVKRGFRNTTYQLIQAVTFWFPIVGGRQQAFKGTLNHHKKVTKNCQEPKPLFATGHASLVGGIDLIQLIHANPPH